MMPNSTGLKKRYRPRKNKRELEFLKKEETKMEKHEIYLAYYRGLSNCKTLEVNGEPKTFEPFVGQEVDESTANRLEMNSDFSIVSTKK